MSRDCLAAGSPLDVRGALISEVDSEGTHGPSRGPNIPSIQLPHQEPAYISHIALDIGGSLIKLVYFSPDSPEGSKYKANGDGNGTPSTSDNASRGGRLHFMKFETSQIEKAIDFIEREGLHRYNGKDGPKEMRVIATGGGAYKYSDIFKERLGLVLEKEDEMQCLVSGCNFILKALRHEAFMYDRGVTTFVPTNDDASLYPYLLVNIGSGVSVVRVAGDNQFERVSGSSLGGGTFWGLCSLLTGVSDFDQILAMSMKGDNSVVDMLVGDIYGGRDYTSIGLSASTIASSFGKVVGQGKPLSEYHAADLCLALCRMTAYNIGQLAYMNAMRYGITRIFFGGFFIRGHPYTMETISYAIRFWSKGEMAAMFLRHEGFLGALGAYIKLNHIAEGGAPGGTPEPQSKVRAVFTERFSTGSPLSDGEAVGPPITDVSEKVSWVEKFLAVGAVATEEARREQAQTRLDMEEENAGPQMAAAVTAILPASTQSDYYYQASLASTSAAAYSSPPQSPLKFDKAPAPKTAAATATAAAAALPSVGGGLSRAFRQQPYVPPRVSGDSPSSSVTSTEASLPLLTPPLATVWPRGRRGATAAAAVAAAHSTSCPDSDVPSPAAAAVAAQQDSIGVPSPRREVSTTSVRPIAAGAIGSAPVSPVSSPPALPGPGLTRDLRRLSLHLGVLHYSPSLEPFPLLEDPASYQPNTIDLPSDEAETRWWLDLLAAQLPVLVQKAVTSEGGGDLVQRRARAFGRAFAAHLDRLRASPRCYGALGLAELLEMREDCLREFGFNDVYRLDKDRETRAAMAVFPDLLQELDAAPPAARLLSLAEGVLAANIFDWGSRACVELYQTGAILDIYRSARQRLARRPWRVDDFDSWSARMRVQGGIAESAPPSLYTDGVSSGAAAAASVRSEETKREAAAALASLSLASETEGSIVSAEIQRKAQTPAPAEQEQYQQNGTSGKTITSATATAATIPSPSAASVVLDEDDNEAGSSSSRPPPPYRRVMMLVDNSGADVVLGMIPLAREFLRLGADVVLAANSLAAINDVTAAELRSIVADAAKHCPILMAARMAALENSDDKAVEALGRGLLPPGPIFAAANQATDASPLQTGGPDASSARASSPQPRLFIFANGQGSPCMDFRRVPKLMAEACAGVDLLIIEGMGRAIHTNFRAKFRCDVLKLAMLKTERLAKQLFGGNLYDAVCSFTPRGGAAGGEGADDGKEGVDKEADPAGDLN